MKFQVNPLEAPSMYMQPVLDKLGRQDVPASAVWEAVLQLFQVRMVADHRTVVASVYPA